MKPLLPSRSSSPPLLGVMQSLKGHQSTNIRVYIAAALTFLAFYALWSSKFVPHPSHGAQDGLTSRKGLPGTEGPKAQQGRPDLVRDHGADVPEIWARGPVSNTSAPALASMPAGDLQQLKTLCGRGLYRTLTSYVRVHQMGRMTIVLTGDIPAMWIRDSAVQMASYFPRIAKRPAIRFVIEGAIRAQAFFILQDPWANAYNPAYVAPSSLRKQDRQLGRGGWVWTRNFELDSVAYFFNLLWNYFATPAIWQPQQLLGEPLVHDAVVRMLQVLEIEQHHEERSPYRYSELAREGLGPKCGYTGMVWSAFRASDDPQHYSYHIPDNMYLVGALERLLTINEAVWKDTYVEATCRRLVGEIVAGINKYGVVTLQDGSKIYAYEVDGLGQTLHDFDDPNLPSLLAMPLLGYKYYDPQIYEATRSRILSSHNAYYFTGSQLKGMGSPHTPHSYVWPLATAVEALTTNSSQRQVELLQDLLKEARGNGLVHESVEVNNPDAFTRPEFGWANAMAAVAIEQLLGLDCDEAAEAHRTEEVGRREAAQEFRPANRGQDRPYYYEMLEATVQHVAA